MAVLFSDGFESNDFTAWTATTTGGGSTLAVESNNPHSGTYNAIGAALLDANDYVTARKTVGGDLTEMYIRTYLKFNQLPTNGHFLDIGVSHQSATSALSWSGIANVADEYFWTIDLKDSDSWTLYSEAVASDPSINTYYCVELYSKIHATTGASTLWVDGVQKVAVTGKDTDNPDDPIFTEAKVGAYVNDTEASPFTAYFDDCVVDVSYIGLARSIPVMMHHYNRINKIIRG